MTFQAALKTFPETLKALLIKAEQSQHVERTIRLVDAFIRIVGNRHYKGKNPAVASVYAPLRVGMIVVAAIAFVTLVFGMLVPIDSAAIAKGSVAVSSKRKTVQHLEGGVVKAILVKEGDLVKEGQPLVEISDIAPKASRDLVQNELWIARAAELRLQALKENKGDLEFPEAMLEAAKDSPELKKTLRTQADLFKTQRDAQAGKLATLKQRITKSREEMAGLSAQLESAKSQHALINEEIDSVQKLLKQGLSTKPRLLSLQRQGEGLLGSEGEYAALIAKAEQSMTEMDMEVINLENEFSNYIAEEFEKVASRINDLEKKLDAASDVMTRTVVAAPSEGRVTGLKFHTVGGVVAPGAAILDIVPQDDQLVLEVRVEPTDIDVVHTGLQSRVTFPALKSRRLPVLTGEVVQVSADAFSEQQGLHNVSYYTARVEVDSKQLDRLGAGIKLYPGMPADVFINTGSRSFVSYLFAPLTDSMNRAFKED